MRLFWIISIILTLPISVGAQGQINLLGQFTPANYGRLSDVWGYVDNGTEYAVIGALNEKKIWFIDVTNPAAPSQVQALAVPSFDFKIRGNYLYSVDGDRNGTDGRITNIADLMSPILGSALVSSHNIWITDGGVLVQSDPDMTLRSLANPEVPLYLWEVGGGATGHDAFSVGTTLYEFRGYTGTFIWDITDPSQPQQLSRIFSSEIFAHSGSPSEDGRYVFVCNELAVHPTEDITVWDVINPAVPVRVASITDPTATVHNLYIIDNLMYVSYYTAGFKVFDVTDPTQPQLLDTYDTSILTGEGFNGAFGVYPFTPSGNIYISDQDGLFVFEFSDPVPTLFSSVGGAQHNQDVRLYWDFFSDETLSHLEVRRKTKDSIAFSVVASNLPKDAREWVDTDVQPGQVYVYKIHAVGDGSPGGFSSEFEVKVASSQPQLAQNFPNPFNPTTTITFEIGRSSAIELTVFDAQGRVVRTLVNSRYGAGVYSVDWDGTTNTGESASSGVYFYRLQTNSGVFTRRMTLLK